MTDQQPKKRVLFRNSKEEPKVEIEEAPRPMPRSTSTTGLSTLSRGLLEQEQRQTELSETIDSVKEIVAKYETEISKLQEYGREQSKVIEQQKQELDVCKSDLIKTREEIVMLLKQIDLIWNS